MTTITHKYLVYNKQGFIDTLNKIIKRYKVTTHLTWMDTYDEKLIIDDRECTITRHPVSVDFDFDGFKIDGYTYLGNIKDEMMMGFITIHGNDLLDGRDVNDFVSSFDDIPCHNCNRRHKRKIGHLFLNHESNEILVFGSSCAKNFFGINFDRLLNFFERVDSTFDDEWNEDYIRGIRDTSINWKYIAAVAHYFINKDGFTSGTKAKERGMVPTSDIVSRFDQDDDSFTKDIVDGFKSSDKPSFDVIMNTDYAKDKDNPTDFEYNIQMIQEKMIQDIVSCKEVGFVTYMVYNEFFNHKNKTEKVEYTIPEWAVKGYRAKKGSVDYKSEVTNIHEFEGHYGKTFIYSFVSDNICFKWFTSVDQDVKVGDKVSLIGFTVKNTTDDSYGKSVIINRVIVVKDGKTPPEPLKRIRKPVVSKTDRDYFERMGIITK